MKIYSEIQNLEVRKVSLMRQDVGETVRFSENRDFRKSRSLAAYGRLEEVSEPQMLTRRRPN